MTNSEVKQCDNESTDNNEIDNPADSQRLMPDIFYYAIGFVAGCYAFHLASLLKSRS